MNQLRKPLLIITICLFLLLVAACGRNSSGNSGSSDKGSGDQPSSSAVQTETETPTPEVTTEPETEDPLAEVLGTTKWVRTPVTVFENEKDAKIAGFLKKGEPVRILNYDRIIRDKTANMFMIEHEDCTGWVYAKYLADTEEAAHAVNDRIYDIHKDRNYTYDLYGGSATSLDWFPVEKEQFPGNPLLEDARCMYLCMDAIYSIEDYLDLAKESGVNCIVLDIKDGWLICPFDIAAEVAPISNSLSFTDPEDVAEAVQKIKDAGMYLVLRIVTFNDEYYGEDHPEECIDSPESWQLWPSAYSRDVWYYNVALAEEAIEKFHPNEIQFDYVRFPEQAFAMSDAGNTDFKNEYDEEKAEAVQNFIYYACDRVHTHGVYVSVDVFAECANDYVTAYGQYFPAISNIVDVISAMPYTDHFGRSVDTWTYPYSLLYTWGQNAAARQSEIETPALVRTWLTGYSVPFWDPVITVDADYVIEEAQAIYNAGLMNGFLLWNGGSNYWNYANIGYAWGYDYIANIPEDLPPVEDDTGSGEEGAEEPNGGEDEASGEDGAEGPEGGEDEASGEEGAEDSGEDEGSGADEGSEDEEGTDDPDAASDEGSEEDPAAAESTEEGE